MKELYIKKFWDEENILFYLHSLRLVRDLGDLIGRM